MAVRVGINGFGRIGRLSLRAILEKYAKEIEVVALNDLVPAKTNAHLFKYDTNYGPWPGEVKAEPDAIIVDGHRIAVYAEKDPGKIPWQAHGIQVVVESTGIFTDALGDPAKGKGMSMITFENEPFQKTLLRGCEWAATGTVTAS